MNGFDLIGNSKHVERITPYPTEEEMLEEEMNKPKQEFTEFGLRRRTGSNKRVQNMIEKLKGTEWFRDYCKREGL